MLLYDYNYRGIVLGAWSKIGAAAFGFPIAIAGGFGTARAADLAGLLGIAVVEATEDVDSGDAAESSGPAAAGSAAGAAFVSVWLMTDNMARHGDRAKA